MNFALADNIVMTELFAFDLFARDLDKSLARVRWTKFDLEVMTLTIGFA